MTWPDLLDGYEATIRRVEDALADGRLAEAGIEAFAQPDPPASLPTPADMERYRALRGRADKVAQRLAAATADAEGAIGEGRQRLRAARAYGER